MFAVNRRLVSLVPFCEALSYRYCGLKISTTNSVSECRDVKTDINLPPRKHISQNVRDIPLNSTIKDICWGLFTPHPPLPFNPHGRLAFY